MAGADGIGCKRAPIAEAIPHERHVLIEQAGTDEVAALPARDRLAGLHDLDDADLGPGVHQTALAFGRVGDQLGHAVVLANRAPERLANRLTLMREEWFRVGDRNLQAHVAPP